MTGPERIGALTAIDPDLAPGDPAEPRPGRQPARHLRTRWGARAQPRILAAIAAGGAPGAFCRYALGVAITSPAGSFPWATFSENVSGSFLLGVLVTLISERFPPTRYLRPFAATGFCGAYTTFSAFSVDADLLVRSGHSTLAAVYVLSSVAAGLAAVVAGILLGRRVPLGPRLLRSLSRPTASRHL